MPVDIGDALLEITDDRAARWHALAVHVRYLPQQQSGDRVRKPFANRCYMRTPFSDAGKSRALRLAANCSANSLVAKCVSSFSPFARTSTVQRGSLPWGSITVTVRLKLGSDMGLSRARGAVDYAVPALYRLLIRFISMVSRMRLPDAARVAFYHKDFLGGVLGAWTQAAMRGPSTWTVGERELMAAMVAKWNSCPFCVGAHGAIAAKEMPRPTVDDALRDYRAAPISAPLAATLAFLEKLTLWPDELTPGDAIAALAAGVTPRALEDAIAVASIFNIVPRYANALGFAIPTTDEFDRAGDMLLRRGYA